jgi:hypothetical protein
VAVLGLTTWGWSRGGGGRRVVATSAAALALAASAFTGWDAARGVGELGVIAAVLSLVWLASRSRPPAGFIIVLALGLALLAVWGLWQSIFGLERLGDGVAALPDAARDYARERLASHRAYASLPVPGHLAVMLATALPLLVARIRRSRLGLVSAIGAGLTLAGLAATRSPIGLVLALLAVAAVVVGRRRGLAAGLLGVLAVVTVMVIALRPDVARLEPVALRLDNWRTALWLWSTSPVDGAGLAGFAQATQGSPLSVGNRPSHAHNLPLETLAELGPIGLLGLAAAAAALVAVIAATWRRDRALAAAIAVVPLHNLVDFSLFVTGVAVPWAVLVGWAASTSWESPATPASDRGRFVLVVAAAVVVAATVLHASSVVVEESAAAMARPEDRCDGAVRALTLAPWRIEPQFLLAAAALESGEPVWLDRAWEELERRRVWRPRSAALADRRARVALARGDVSTAAAELWAATTVASADPAPAAAWRDLLRALDREPRGR